MKNVVVVVELDVPVCSLTYGSAPCTAAVGVTGTRKCFNTIRTCQDRNNFDEDVLTLRFMRPSSVRDSFDGIPILASVSVTPQVLDPGVSIGKRESVSINFEDCLHSDAGIDKYLADRGYDTFARGTFWGKFRARLPSITGAALRVKRGEVGQSVDTMTTWHYVVESTNGPAGGRFQIIAKDPLKLADGNRAQAPRISQGVLSAPLASGAGSCTLEPAGIGSTYDASGMVAIGGVELATFTRSGDVLTLTGRGLLGSQDADHEEEARVQAVLQYVAQSPAAIIADLLTTYTDIDPSWIDLAAWQIEIDAYTPRLYSAVIAEPVAVSKLLNELVNQVGLVVWSDTNAQMIRLIGLRNVQAGAAVFDANRRMADTFRSTEQLGKRVSECWCYYGILNPLESDEDPKNFAAVAVNLDDTGADLEYGAPAYRKVFSRWVNMFNRTAAHRVNEVLLSRFRDPPRRFNWEIYATDTAPQVGGGVFLEHDELQDDTGEEVQVPAQVVSLIASDDRFQIEAEEMSSGDGLTPDANEKTIFIDVNNFNLNLRTVYDSIFSAPDIYDVVTFILSAGANVGTRKGGNGWGIDTGEWPELEGDPSRLVLNIFGRAIARGGDGGDGAAIIGSDGEDGEHALRVRVPMSIDNQGIIGGGGGGGGGGNSGQAQFSAGGGGGAGFEASNPGNSGNSAADATGGYLETPGTGPGNAGDGGTLGQDGDNGATADGGEAGVAIHGDDLVTWINEGTILGDRLDSTDPLP